MDFKVCPVCLRRHTGRNEGHHIVPLGIIGNCIKIQCCEECHDEFHMKYDSALVERSIEMFLEVVTSIRQKNNKSKKLTQRDIADLKALEDYAYWGYRRWL